MANIHDVARVAGVSISTVSYALSGKRSIAESTRRRIDDAVLKLDYRPNAGARMLKGTRTNILALSAPLHSGTYAPAHMTFVLSVATAARKYDYDVLLLTQDEATSGLRRVARSSLVDGIILLDVSTCRRSTCGPTSSASWGSPPHWSESPQTPQGSPVSTSTSRRQGR